MYETNELYASMDSLEATKKQEEAKDKFLSFFQNIFTLFQTNV